jgi:hypothetical protein
MYGFVNLPNYDQSRTGGEVGSKPRAPTTVRDANARDQKTTIRCLFLLLTVKVPAEVTNLNVTE